ncbi:hypothetical protein [Pacificoceanicola onchidii]|uniref:hypothetical protein n=1 Tax=Pacificoceanicola onchidii TaxID=2562685 RepID=UPI0010A66D54|nr:hypothetical protein [Pacificoceanicola onchidii]
MAHSIFHRAYSGQHSGVKAVALAALMAVAVLMGDMPHPVSGEASNMVNPVTERLVPALFNFADCEDGSHGVDV